MIYKKSIKRIILPILIILTASPLLHSQSRVDDIHKYTMQFQKKIIKKNMEHQRRILARFNLFAKMVANVDRTMKVKIPVDPGYANKIKRNTHTGRTKREPAYYAYMSEPYKMRSKPSDGNRNYVRKLRKGTRVRVIYQVENKKKRGEITRKWCYVKYYRTPGFVPLNLLSKYRPRAEIIEIKQKPLFAMYDPSTVITSGISHLANSLILGRFTMPNAGDLTNAMKRKMRVNANPYLNMRKRATTRSSVVGKLYYNDIVDVVRYGRSQRIGGRWGRWLQVQHNGQRGWAFSAFLEKVKVKRVRVRPKLKSGQTWYVKAQNLRLRENAGAYSTVMLSIPHQEEVYILRVKSRKVKIGSIRSNWVRVNFEGYKGWVFGGYLDTDKSKYIIKDSIIQKKRKHSQFVWPVRGYKRVSSPYGYRRIFGRRSFHRGIDIVAPRGAPIVAAKSGQCILRWWDRYGYGHYIIMEHGDGKRTLYGHMSKPIAVKGRRYRKGQLIGLVGSTGSSTGPHLHFEVRIHNKPVNPSSYIHPRIR